MKKILFADDDEGILDAIRMALEIFGYNAIATGDGKKVIPLLQQQPDLIIIDTWMSGIDGRDVCREIKADPGTKNIPLMMISATHEIRASALQAGADEFMAKPLEMPAFLHLIEQMLM